MKLEDKKILLISPESWDHIFVSKHHYAIHLGKRNNRVFFLGPPADREMIRPTHYENVFEVTYKGFVPGLRFLPVIIQRWLILSIFKRIEQLAEVRFDVIWSFDNSVFFDFSALPAGILKISHIVDASQDFQTEKAAKTADICFSVTEQIRNTLSRFNTRVYKVNHAYNIYVNHGVSDLARSPKTRAVYAGNLSIPYIDWQLIRELVANFPQVDFVFIGPNEREMNGYSEMEKIKKDVSSRSNTSFPGTVRSDELLQWYTSADILFLAYQEKYQDSQVANPHKMMEYLGSGKVVVATKTLEYLNFYPMIVMSDRNRELPTLFAQVLENLLHYNSEILRGQRRSFALENTYDKQIDKIEKIISDL